MKSKIDQFVINKVKEKRLTVGYSQLTLAAKLGMGSGFIGKVENKKYPSHYNLKHLNKLAKIFNCSPKEFLPDTSV